MNGRLLIVEVGCTATTTIPRTRFRAFVHQSLAAAALLAPRTLLVASIVLRPPTNHHE